MRREDRGWPAREEAPKQPFWESPCWRPGMPEQGPGSPSSLSPNWAPLPKGYSPLRDESKRRHLDTQTPGHLEESESAGWTSYEGQASIPGKEQGHESPGGWKGCREPQEDKTSFIHSLQRPPQRQRGVHAQASTDRHTGRLVKWRQGLQLGLRYLTSRPILHQIHTKVALWQEALKQLHHTLFSFSQTSGISHFVPIHSPQMSNISYLCLCWMSISVPCFLNMNWPLLPSGPTATHPCPGHHSIFLL